MRFLRYLLCGIVLLALASCDFMTQRGPAAIHYPPLSPDLAADQLGPVELKEGDNIPGAILENTHRLSACVETHRQTVAACTGKTL